MTKTTLHVQRFEKWMPDAVAALGSTWVKEVNPPAHSDPWAPGVKRDIRIWTDDIDAQFVPRDEDGGRDFVRHMLPRWRENPDAECYELANEPGCKTPEDLAHLRRYSIGAMQEADRQGIKLCILNLPEGNPAADEDLTGEEARKSERWKLEQLFEAVQYACEHGHYVGLHAYWRPGVEGPTGRWHALSRVVWAVGQWRGMGLSLDHLQLLVNETGIDGGIQSGPGEGWRTHNSQGYFHEVARAEAFVRRLSWILAIFLFTAGYENPWASFDHEEGDIRKIRDEIELLPPVVPPPPQPPPISDWRHDEGLRQVIRKAAWDQWGLKGKERIERNLTAALYKAADLANFGAPMTAEHELAYGSMMFVWQGFSRAVLYTRIGEWEVGRIWNTQW